MLLGSFVSVVVGDYGSGYFNLSVYLASLFVFLIGDCLYVCSVRCDFVCLLVCFYLVV